MSKLIEAAQKQIGYARNEYESGDTAKGGEHLTKAEGFLDRASNEVDEANANVVSGADWSPDRNVAIHQILAETGHPTVLDENGASQGVDPANVRADASSEQVEALTVLGFFGGPPQNVDSEPWDRYYETKEATGLDESGQPTGGGIALREGFDTGNAVWTHYLENR